MSVPFQTLRRTQATLALCLSAACVPACGEEIEYYGSGVRRAEGAVASRSAGSGLGLTERETGTWTYWYPNGERREQGRFERGQRTGTWTQWYPNGQRKNSGARAYDPLTHSSPRQGLWTFWHENGERMASGIFRHGRREGHWDYALEDGAIDSLRTGEYHDDELLDCAGELEPR